MDINGFIKPKEREKIIKSKSDSLIRTMQDDIIALGGKKNNKKASPPDSLPIVELVNEAEIKAREEAKIKAKEIQERQRKLREQAEIKAQKEAEKQRELRERAEKERIKAQKEVDIRIKEEAKKREEEAEKRRKIEEKARKEAEEKAKEEAEKREEEAEKRRKTKEREIKKAQRAERIKEIKIKLAENAPKLIAGLIIVSLIVGTGTFFYWWNYVRVIPAIITHFECQNEQCVKIEGEGNNQCQLNEDCKPIIPEQLISSYKIETIELPTEKYGSFISRLESIYRTKQEKDTFKSILIKLIKDTKKEYADLYSFISIFKIDIPENIKNTITDSEINGDNYNLFLHNNGEENRVGLIMSMGQSSDLVQNLKAWEETMVADIRSFIFKDKTLESAIEGFQDNIYNEVTIRYINFPTSDLSIDYALIGNKLVITTSKDSMYAIIDALISN